MNEFNTSVRSWTAATISTAAETSMARTLNNRSSDTEAGY